MPRDDEWHVRAVCPECGWSIYAPFGDIFHVHITCCPQCGCEKYDGPWHRDLKYWETKTMRRVGTTKLMKPSTWGTGYWEILDSDGDSLFRRTKRFCSQ